MKKSRQTIIYLGIAIVVCLALWWYISAMSVKKVSVMEFYNQAGIFMIDENFDETVFTNRGQKIIHKSENFIIVDRIAKVDGNGSVTLVDKKIDKIVVDGYVLHGYSGKIELYKTNYSRTELDGLILKAFGQNGATIEYTDPNAGSFLRTILPVLFSAGIAVVLFFLIRGQINAQNKTGQDFGKTNAQIITNVKVRFTDIAGADEEKQELQEIIEFLKSPEKFADLGARVPRGVLLVGQPGTGKTLFAKAVAGESNVPFFSISGSDFVEMYVGVGASRVRDLFNTAKKVQPCIIFIDEIDAVGRQRGAGLGGGNDEREQTLNQLLVQMDGFATDSKIIIMAATNRADVLDPALLRPGRFDRQIYVNLPDVKGREQILRVHSRNKPLAKEVSFKTLARMTAGFSGADLANLLNEAAILTARENRRQITNTDLYEAINKVIMGPQKKSRIVTETDKRITAYHEAGHAILAKLLPHCDPVQEVSIIPRGMAAGYTMTRPDSDDNHLTKARLLDDIVMTLGGRVAEELIIHDVSAGASNDISVITKRARKMVSEWGMSDKIGPVSYGDGQEIFMGRDYQTRSSFSEEKAKTIDAEVELIIKTAHDRATELLSQNVKLLETMAMLLLERETIYSDEVDLIMQGKSAEEILQFMTARDEKGTKYNPLNATKKTVEESAKATETKKAEEEQADGKTADKPDDSSDDKN